jgi:hypothetical protein
MTYKEVVNSRKAYIPNEYASNNEIFVDLSNLLSQIKYTHGQFILDPEDQKGMMPPRTPKVVLGAIAKNIAAFSETFKDWEYRLIEILTQIPEDKTLDDKMENASLDQYPKKVPWYRRCFCCGCCK